MNNDFLIDKDGDLLKYKGNESIITIPEKVTSIAPHFLNQCNSDIKEVVITKNTKIIYYSAFFGCKTLEKVTIEGGLIEIGDNAFDHCINLKEVYLSEGVKKIGEGVFSYCKNLKKIVLPDSIDEIGKKSFEFCKDDIEIIASNDVFALAFKQFTDREKYMLAFKTLKNKERINAISTYYKRNDIPIIIGISDSDDVEMLKNFLSLYKKITADKIDSYIELAKNSKYVLNELIQYKENYCSKKRHKKDENIHTLTSFKKAFKVSVKGTKVIISGYKGNDETISIPVKIEKYKIELGEKILKKSPTVKTVILEKGIKKITQKAFFECESIESVILPESLIEIEAAAFSCCRGLKDIIIPNKVTTIDKYAFASCFKLTKIVIPDSVTFIDDEAFVFTNNVTIYGNSNSYAERFANAKGIPFVIL